MFIGDLNFVSWRIRVGRCRGLGKLLQLVHAARFLVTLLRLLQDGSQLSFRRTPGKMTYVAMRAVPMGWTNSVALLQNVLRNLLYETIQVPREVDVNPRQRVLRGDAMVACMDGADYITRLRMVNSELRRYDGGELPKAGERHPIMQKRRPRPPH